MLKIIISKNVRLKKINFCLFSLTDVPRAACLFVTVNLIWVKLLLLRLFLLFILHFFPIGLSEFLFMFKFGCIFVFFDNSILKYLSVIIIPHMLHSAWFFLFFYISIESMILDCRATLQVLGVTALGSVSPFTWRLRRGNSSETFVLRVIVLLFKLLFIPCCYQINFDTLNHI